MNEINNKDKLAHFNCLNSLPKKINKLYFKKLKGKFKLINKSKKKGGFDPVTNIDREIELFLRTEISKKFPKDGIIGEENKVKRTKSGFTWVIDPIDGTRSFIIGSPTWSNLISINHNNTPILGLVNFPMLKKYYITGINRSSYLVERNKLKKLKVLKSTSFDSAKIAGSFFGWLSLKKQMKIPKLVDLVRYPCSDALSYCQLCEGKLDVVMQCSNKIWDVHPMIPLIKNAGGYITTWDNKDPKIAGNIVASSNVTIHKRILKMLKPVLKD
jgi:myo-inositol-1(or 4)-monophosphatase|tara:strand:+ start:1580 stop:2392 length:813 start_codon:yes stop_codon:yes gene_type:complete